MNGHGSMQPRQSRRQARRARMQKARMTLLALCIVIILLLVTLAIFLFCAIADELNQDTDIPTTPPDISDPSGNTDILYQTVTKDKAAVSVGDLLLVNEDHYYDPASAPDLMIIDGTQGSPKTYTVAYSTWKLNAGTLSAFNGMMKKYYEISGDDTVKVSSAYRTAKDQEGKATPVGHSDHHTGYCLALRTVAGEFLKDDHWIYENGHRYGFIRRYPNEKATITGVSDYEYCIRYVGIPHATYMVKNDLCLEEYVELLKTSYSGGTHLSLTDDAGNQYEIYYVASTGDHTSLQVPSNYAYTVSGDNVGGFIVTVNLSHPLA